MLIRDELSGRDHASLPRNDETTMRRSAIIRGRGRSRLGRRTIIEGAALLVAAILPLLLQEYLTIFATRTLILAMLALSFDLIWGYAGIMSFGQALFFGIAGYCTGLLARDAGIVSAFILLPAGALVGLLAALMIGGFLLLGRGRNRIVVVTRGALVSTYIAGRIAQGWYYPGADNGIPSIPTLSIGGWEVAEGWRYYYVSLFALVCVYLVCRHVVRSQFGLALAGIRVNEQRIIFFGYDVQWIKALVFALSGMIAGLGGTLYAFHEGFVSPSVLGIVLSTQAVLYVLLGGAGTLIGAVIGTVVVEIASFWLSNTYQNIWPILLGLALLVVILFRPAGLISLLLSERERVGAFGEAGGDDHHAPA